MENKKRIGDKERMLRYLLRKGIICNTYKIARELGIERTEVLNILHELAKENKVKLKNGSVRAITRELSEEEKIKTKSEVEELNERMDKLEKTKSEVEELNERVEKLEKWIGAVFTHLKKAIYVGNQTILRKNKSEENVQLIEKDIKI